MIVVLDGVNDMYLVVLVELFKYFLKEGFVD